MPPKFQRHTASFFHANTHGSSFEILKSLLSRSLRTPSNHLPCLLYKAGILPTWHSWDTKDSAVKHIAIFAILKNIDIYCSSGMFYLCPNPSDRTKAARKQSLPHKSAVFTKLKTTQVRSPLFNMAPIWRIPLLTQEKVEKFLNKLKHVALCRVLLTLLANPMGIFLGFHTLGTTTSLASQASYWQWKIFMATDAHRKLQKTKWT